ncbi:MAG: UDP-N-acetylglucosamine 2-epimerase (non-hydrolyzing) [Rhodothermales bacterium]
MGRRVNVLSVVGTRPEAIKMAPVIEKVRAAPWARCRVLATAQHREMLDQVLDLFSITPDIDLDAMRPNQTLPELTSRLIDKLDRTLAGEKPDVVLAQGDTTTVMTTALACFYRGIPFGHVEAGLRTGNMTNPFPEEMNRVVAGRLATWNFAPTEISRTNLLAEGISDSKIFVTGNTVIDALLETKAKAIGTGLDIPADKRLLLLTAHRRENFGEPIRAIFKAIQRLVEAYPDLYVLYPVHPNPNVKDVAREMLGEIPGVKLCAPLEYGPFVSAMDRAHIILSDSGGVQEEAPALAKPVLVLRAETERPEAVSAGVVRLVGTDTDDIVRETCALLDDPVHYAAMAQGASPYGDGHAAERILRVLERDLMP